MVTDESSQNDFARSTWSKEGISYKHVTRKTKPQLHAKQVGKNRPELGRGRGGIRYKNPTCC